MPPSPLVVAASADRLVQAFGNIVDNAVSFSPLGGRVLVSLHARDDSAIVTVEDEGPGTPPEHIDRIFDRFFTFRPGTADARRQHDGLGLAIAKAIIDGYGGTIHTENLATGGTKIEVRMAKR